MGLAILTRAKRHVVRTVLRLRDCQKGVAALEFAYLAPVLLVMLLGTIEVSRGIGLDRRFGLVTSMVGDLVAREKTIGPTPATSLFGIMQSAQTVMAPYDSTSLKMRIISVMALKTDTTQGSVRWAYDCTNTSCTAASNLASCSPYTLPTGIVSQFSSVIVVESSMAFSPLFMSWKDDPLKATDTAHPWTDKSTHSPRQACVDDGNGCPTSTTACP